MPALLTGTTDPLTMKRSRCAAGHKAMWHPDWEGLPPEAFLVKRRPVLEGPARAAVHGDTHVRRRAPAASPPSGRSVSGWSRDRGGGGRVRRAHGRRGRRHHRPHAGEDHGDVDLRRDGGPAKRRWEESSSPGICGQVDGSVIPGMIGLEAGQSAFGDVYAWFKDILAWPLQTAAGASGRKGRGPAPKRAGDRGRDPGQACRGGGESGPRGVHVAALDWLNGRRTPFADQTLKGAIVGLTLGTTAPKIFRALVEATAFGSRAIVEQFRKEGVPINAVIAQGGIARKSPFVMQVTADVLGMPIRVAASDQAWPSGRACSPRSPRASTRTCR